MYKLDNDQYPGAEQRANALIVKTSTGVTPSQWRQQGSIEKNDISIDPWVDNYIYVYPGRNHEYEIYSLGQDQEPWGLGYK